MNRKRILKARRKYQRWAKRNPEASILECAKMLMKCYLPRAEFRAGLNTWSWAIWRAPYGKGKPQTDQKLVWRITHGIHTMPHEIAHVVHNHFYEEPLPIEWSEYIKEIEAWVWAEHECHLLGIPFDHLDAELAIERRRKKKNIPALVLPRWRHLPVEKEDD